MARLTNHRLSPIIAPLDLALAPLRALARGHIILILFTGAIALPVWFFSLFFGKILMHLVEHWIGLSNPFAAIVPSVVYLSVWIIALPFFLSAALLPIRLLWHNDSLKVEALISGALPSLQRTAVAIMFSTLGLLLIILAFCGVVGSSKYLLSNYLNQTQLLYLQYGVIFTLGIGLMRTILFCIMLPIVSISLGLSINEARHLTLRSLTSASWLLTLFIAACVASAYYTNLFFHGGALSISEVSVIEVSSYGIILWYFAVVSACFVLGANESTASSHFKALRGAASPIKVTNTLPSQVQLEQSDDSKKRKVLAEKKRRATTALTPKDVELIFR